MATLYEPIELELSNKIPVILQHCEGLVAATYWWVNTGSADENPGEAGFAHFLEHMLFKDAAAKESGRPSEGQTARYIESLGGDINAYTSFDQTVYHVTCAAHQWENVLDRFGPIAKPQKFLAKDFESEREVILEELRKNDDSPGRQAFQTLFGLTFKKHPYGRPVIGTERGLRKAKLKDLEAFYRRRYISGNMGLLLVGPIEGASDARKKKLLAQAEKYFGSKVFKAKPGSPRRAAKTAVLTEMPQWDVKRFDVKTPSISFSFRVPELGHEDLPALDLVAGILGMGELSQMYQRLFCEMSLVTDVSGGLYVPKDAGMLYFQTEFEDMKNIAQVMSEILTVIQKLTEVKPTQDEMNRVLVNAESERLYSTQSADGMAGRNGFLKFVAGDMNFDQVYLEKMRQVTPEEIQTVAKKYLDFRRMSGVLLLPNDAADFQVEELIDLSVRKLDFGVALKSEVKKAEKKSASQSKGAIASPLRRRTLDSGMEIRSYYRPNSHVFSIHASTLGGLRLELGSPIESAGSDWGSSFLMALAWQKGTQSKDAKKIAELIEGRAASLDGFSGRNSVGLQMIGLQRDWADLSGLFTEVLLDPAFTEEEVNHARRLSEDSVRSVSDHSSQLCSKLFLETLYKEHPYGKMPHGSLESLKQINSQKLKRFHQAWVRPERLVISVSGPIDDQTLDAWIDELNQRAVAFAVKTPELKLPTHLSSEPALSDHRLVEQKLGREQVHILMGGLGTQITSEDRFALRLLQNLLGGQSGRLFIELREKKSLAYSVAPVSFEGVERGYVGTYIACAEEKRLEAEKGVVKVLEGLLKKGPSRKEMARASEFFLGRRAMDLQSDSAIASHYGLETLYGLSTPSEDAFVKKIRGITAVDLQKVCERYLVKPHQVTSVVG